MKKNFIHFLTICFICSFITSCASSSYMQISTLKSEQVKLHSDGSFKSEHSDFTVEYNFWSRSGNLGFLITNNSDKDLYLNLEKSYFINNGYAYDYYQNRTFIYSYKSSIISSLTSSRSSITGTLNSNNTYNQHTSGNYSNYAASINSNSYGSYSSNSRSSGYSLSSNYSSYSENGTTVEYLEDKIVCIPAHSSKYFEEFEISSTIYRECGFPRNPSKKEEVVLEFVENDSPRVFENRLMFILDDNEIPVNHKFYVCEIQNVLEDEIYEEHFKKDCNGNEIIPPVLVNKKASSDKYYLRYKYTKVKNNTKDFSRSYNDDRIKKKRKNN